jgi:DNA polymerase III sliding clamp (beta) subunit (PCNA family)
LEGKGLSVTAYELDQTCAQIGERLVPWATWVQENPFEHIAEIEGRFDWVLANPPFGTKWGLYSAEQICKSGATRSEYMFLELALRALKPGGYAAFIAPQTFLTTGTKKFRLWLQQNGAVIRDEGIPLSGEFALTKINVCLFLFERIGAAIPVAEINAPVAAPIIVTSAIAVNSDAADATIPTKPTAIIDRSILVEVLALVKPAVKKGGDIAFRITPDGIALVASHERGDVYVTRQAQTFAAPTSDLFPLVPAQTLVDLVSAMDSGPITITEADGKLHLKGWNCTAHIALRSGSCSMEIVHRIVTEEGPCVILTGEQLASLARTTPASSDEENRPELTALNLSVEGDQLTAACADGFILALRHMEIPNSDAKRRALVDADWMNAVLRASKAGQADQVELHLQKNGLMLHIPAKNVYYHFWDVASNFPDFGPTLNKFLPAKGPAIRMNVKRWQTFLRRSQTYFRTGGNLVLATIGCQLYAAADSEELGATEDVLGDYDGGQPGWVVMGPAIAKSLIEILAAETDEVTFHFGETNTNPPVILAGNLTVIAMPLHVGEKPQLVKRQESGVIPLLISFPVTDKAEAESVSV